MGHLRPGLRDEGPARRSSSCPPAAGISGGAANWSSGFLPTVYTGVRFRNQGDPILERLQPRRASTPSSQRDTLDLIGELNRQRLDAVGDPEIATRIAAYEMAFRLQTVRAGADGPRRRSRRRRSTCTACDPAKPSFARACLLARRMVERGVRFVNIYHEGWDAHSDVAGNLKTQLRRRPTRPSAALVTDLKQRGLLDDTLVDLGRRVRPHADGRTNPALGRSLGRDHHPQASPCGWPAAASSRASPTAQTDDLGFHVVEDPVHVHDLQATILHLLGLDHERLTYRYRAATSA